jgi:CO/xanthine dehydrogenase Mo-binding subunit
MVHSRDEEFTSSRTRHPQVLYIKTGVKKDGTITARQGRVVLDNGAYTSYGPGVSLTESMLGGALYRLPAYRYDGYVVYTNNPFGGAFRGFDGSRRVPPQEPAPTRREGHLRPDVDDLRHRRRPATGGGSPGLGRA